MHPARITLPLALIGILVVALAACSAGSQPGWTFAPTPTPTVAPSTVPSASSRGSQRLGGAIGRGILGGSVRGGLERPVQPASAAPSTGASAAPSGGTGGTVLNEVASGVNYQTTSFQAPAYQPFQIAFDNQDAGIPHNIQIADGSGAFVFEGDTVTGVAQTTYNVPALAAGTYKFSCKWHSTMVGDLTVQ